MRKRACVSVCVCVCACVWVCGCVWASVSVSNGVNFHGCNCLCVCLRVRVWVIERKREGERKRKKARNAANRFSTVNGRIFFYLLTSLKKEVVKAFLLNVNRIRLGKSFSESCERQHFKRSYDNSKLKWFLMILKQFELTDTNNKKVHIRWTN